MFAKTQRASGEAFDLRWDDLQVFLAVLRAGTFSGGARTLRVEVSTASRRITALEETLGARLFDRTPDGLKPTVVAERLMPAAQRAEVAVLEALRAAEGVERAPEGVVRLTCAPGLADQFIAPMLNELVRRYPKLRVHLDARASVADLMRNEADLAVRSVKPTSGDLVMQKLVDSRSMLVASARRAKAVGVVKSFAGLPLINWPSELSMIPGAKWLAEVAPGVEPVLTSNSFLAHLTGAASGLGFAVAPEQFVAVTPGLVQVPVHASVLAKHPLPVETLWLVGHRALRDVPRVAATWAFLVEQFGKR